MRTHPVHCCMLLLATTARIAAAGTVADYAKRTDALKDELSEALAPQLEAELPVDGCRPTTDAERATCAEFVAWHQLAEAERVLSDAQQWLFFMQQIDVATNHEENQGKLVASAKRCGKEIDRLLAAGMPTDIPIRVGYSEPIEIAMHDAKAKICTPLAKRAGTFASDVAAARAQRLAEIAAPYKKAGIGGDRLALLVEHVEYPMFGIGGGELTAPAQLKTAGVIFELIGPSADGHYTLRRYQFSGDKLVVTTSGDFRRLPTARAYR